MKRFFVYLCILMYASVAAFAQQDEPIKYWLIFKDKGRFKPTDEITKGSEAYNEGLKLLSERAIQRRLKVLSEDKLIDYADLPLHEDYVSKISSSGIDIIAKSRWLNGVSAYLTKSQLEKVKAMDFVGQIKLVNKLIKQESFAPFSVSGDFASLNYVLFDSNRVQHKQNYGPSLKQNEAVNVPKVHDMGITGKGVFIASFDDGFDWRNHEALRNLQIVDEYDFINKDDNTFPEKNQKYFDSPGQGGHGTATLSTMAGYMPGKLVGPAFDSQFLLAKTEYVSSETPMEEDFWLEAAEWSEAQGVDIITSSLIYKEYYENLEHPNSYKFDDYDGNTAITSIAGDRCAYLGIAVFNSVGNYDQTAIPSLGSAADGDSVIAVGAITLDGRTANFTSNGPTSDGQIKPDVTAPGVNVIAAQIKSESGNDNTYEHTSGTSFSCPITAGVGALILSANPWMTPMQLRDALRNTANNSSTPNSIVGWGTINAYDALLYYGPVWSNSPEFKDTEDGNTEVRTYLASKELIVPGSVKMYYEENGQWKSITMSLMQSMNDGNNSGYYSGSLNFKPQSGMKYYFESANYSGTSTTYPKSAPDKFLTR